MCLIMLEKTKYWNKYKAILVEYITELYMLSFSQYNKHEYSFDLHDDTLFQDDESTKVEICVIRAGKWKLNSHLP